MKDNKNSKRLRLKIVDFQKDGKGVSKSQADMAPGFKKFFLYLKNNFSKLVSVNIIMVLGNFPLFFLICNFSGYFKKDYFIPFSDLFQNIAGLLTSDGGPTPFKMTLFSLEGLQNQALAPTAVTYVFYALGALVIFTFGIVNAGTAYIIRNMVMGEPVFVWTDFKYAVKRNYKQAIPFGILDVLIIFVLCFNLYTLVSATEKFFVSMMFWSNVVIFIVYFFMRYYMYVQMVTFKLSVFKMIKNSLIFSLLGFKRNICALLGVLIALILEFMFIFGFGGILIPFAVAAPLAILFSACAFMKVYAAYPKIKQHMIDPYNEEHPEEAPEDIYEEPIMRDDVTEKERLEAIKKKNNIK